MPTQPDGTPARDTLTPCSPSASAVARAATPAASSPTSKPADAPDPASTTVTPTFTHGEAAHLTWLLSTGHTRTPWLTCIIERLNEQIPEHKRLVKA